VLWTDALGLSRDEANQAAHEDLTGLTSRTAEIWGSVEAYRANIEAIRTAADRAAV